MRERLKRSPWKGDRGASPSRVQIPSLPPMSKKSVNEIAFEYSDQLWKEYYESHPEELAKLKRDAKQAKEFLKKLGNMEGC